MDVRGVYRIGSADSGATDRAVAPLRKTIAFAGAGVLGGDTVRWLPSGLSVRELVDKLEGRYFVVEMWGISLL